MYVLSMYVFLCMVVFIFMYFVRNDQNKGDQSINQYFADEIFNFIFLYECYCILIKISLKSVPKRSVNNKSELVQIIVFRHYMNNDGLHYWYIYASLNPMNRTQWQL